MDTSDMNQEDCSDDQEDEDEGEQTLLFANSASAIVTVYGYVIHRWQCRLCFCSSTAMFAAGVVMMYQREFLLSVSLLIAAIFSWNYWLHPRAGCPRVLDLIFAVNALGLTQYAAIWCFGAPLLCWLAFGCVTGGVACFRFSWVWSQHGWVSWAYPHAAGHVFCSLAAFFEAIERPNLAPPVEQQILQLVPPPILQNPAAICSFLVQGLIVVELLAKGSKGGPKQEKEIETSDEDDS